VRPELPQPTLSIKEEDTFGDMRVGVINVYHKSLSFSLKGYKLKLRDLRVSHTQKVVYHELNLSLILLQQNKSLFIMNR
jgi:hypothetical protein